ncbi:AvrD family protein [Paenarthrobacter sp. NPDC091711]|uniref:AvrD family protein n=1 Tax=Paenarthrobacter sp. NPDC091711 TaxID=3364385 RepID=UPI00380E97FE
MPLALSSATKTYASIDDLLGDGRSRFFSHGYKTTNPRLRNLRVAHTVAESSLTARAGLGMDGVWSVKGNREQTPHLGTTDVLVLACRMAEALLASRFSPEILPAAYLTSVTISGGSEPVEGSLSDLIAWRPFGTTDAGPS